MQDPDKVILTKSDIGVLNMAPDTEQAIPDQEAVQEVQEDKPVLGTDAQEYYGTKRIWAWPAEKDGNPGYSVRYSDSYISWSPKGVFEEAYQPIDSLSFGHAVAALKAGHRLCRKSLDWAGAFIFLVQGSKFKVNRPPLLGIFNEGTSISYKQHIDIKNADGTIATWSAGNADVLADDWMIL